MKVFRHIREKDGFPREKNWKKYENIKKIGSHDGLPIFESFLFINL